MLISENIVIARGGYAGSQQQLHRKTPGFLTAVLAAGSAPRGRMEPKIDKN